MWVIAISEIALGRQRGSKKGCEHIGLAVSLPSRICTCNATCFVECSRSGCRGWQRKECDDDVVSVSNWLWRSHHACAHAERHTFPTEGVFGDSRLVRGLVGERGIFKVDGLNCGQGLTALAHESVIVQLANGCSGGSEGTDFRSFSRTRPASLNVTDLFLTQASRSGGELSIGSFR